MIIAVAYIHVGILGQTGKKKKCKEYVSFMIAILILVEYTH